MAIIRKYNKELGVWENVASDDAAGIYTDNSILTGDSKGEIKSVEDVLLRDRADIEKLQRNVSWLALHGGGGSGAGGGATASATITVLDPDDDTTPITTLVWSSNISHLSYKLTSNIKTTFKVTVSLNGKTIQTDTITAKNEVKGISITNIKKYIAEGGTLSITAVDPSDTEFSGRCALVVSNVILNSVQMRLTAAQLEAHETNTLNITYRSNVYGNYRLYYCKSQIKIVNGHVVDENGNSLEGDGATHGQYISINIQDSNVQTYRLDLVETGLLDINTVPGGYRRYFMLVYENNIVVRSSSIGALITVMVTDGILVIPQIGSQSAPYTVTKDNILPLIFTVYSNNTGTYNYTVSAVTPGGLEQIGDTVSGKTFNDQVLVNINVNNYDFLEEGKTYEFVIRAAQGGVSSTGSTWISILKANSRIPLAYLKDLNNYTIFDYTFYYNISSITQGQLSVTPSQGGLKQSFLNTGFHYKTAGQVFNNLNSELNFNNIGIDSGSDSTKYKLRHTGHGVITTTTYGWHWFPKNTSEDNNSLISVNDYQWSIQLAYYIGEEVDDNATIFNMGNYDPSTNTGHGIIVTAHKVYVDLEDTYLSCDLQDKSFTQLDIVVEPIQSGNTLTYWLKIYQNAKLLGITQFKRTAAGTGSETINSISLGCRRVLENNDVENNINMDLYSVKFFARALNIGQVVCAFIDNYAYYNMTSSGLDGDLITTMCDNNRIDIENDATITDTSKISSIYNLKTGEYTWAISVLGDTVSLPDALTKLPIPVVTLSVNWSYTDFTTILSGDQTIPASTQSKFSYLENNKLIESNDMTINIQGTTSRGYVIKNLNITFPDGILFSPREDWFPEQTFTLKADIVDSGHINNAAIGKFVNNCFNSESYSSTLMNVSDCFPAVSKVRALQDAEQLPRSLTVKACIEGFPCLLVMNFKNGDTRDARIIGIYSFNLGRESYFNQGYKVPQYLYRADGSRYTVMSEVSFPSLFSMPPLSDIDSTQAGYCFEGQASHNCSTTDLDWNSGVFSYIRVDMGDGTYENYPATLQRDPLTGNAMYGSTILKDHNNQPIPWSSTRLTKVAVNPDGFFWSTHDTFTNNLWKWVGDGTIVNLTDARAAFQMLNNNIATRLLYNKGGVSQAYGMNIDQYRIEGADGGETIRTSKTGSVFSLIRGEEGEEVDVSVKNTSFYYVVAMLFGLIDSLGKNMQMKYWNNGGSKYWSPTFYDMDTALGLDNTGLETVKPTVLDYGLFNTQDGTVTTCFGQLPENQSNIGNYTVYSNKLWGIENADFCREYTQDFNPISSTENNPNFFAQMWHNIRTTMVLSSDQLFEDYFQNQLAGVGEFLINYDFQVKYLGTGQQSFLHGNRLSFIKNWMDKRITFLDSVFGFAQRRQSTGTEYALTSYLRSDNILGVKTNINCYNIPWRNQVTLSHNSGSLTLPIITNTPVIMKTTVGGVNTSYTYVPENTETNIIVAEGIGTQGIQTMINNSNCIIDFPDLQTINLTNILPQNRGTINDSTGAQKYQDPTGNLTYQYGSLSGLKHLDLSGIKTFRNTINFFTLAKTWDTSVLDIAPDYFALQTLNLSNMTTGGNLNVDLTGAAAAPDEPDLAHIYKDPFTEITSVDVSGSDVSRVTIPEGVSLYKLNISNSRIATLSLTNQPLLKNLSFTNCSNLSNIQLIKCKNFETLSFDSSTVSIATVLISECEGLTSLTIDAGSNNTYTHVPTVTIENCPNLKTVTLKNLKKYSQEDPRVLSITGCPELTTINVNNSSYTEIKWDKVGKLSTLDLRLSTVNTFRTLEGGDLGVLDLTFPEVNINFSEYESGQSYTIDSVVHYNGNYYKAIVNNATSVPGSDVTQWTLVNPDLNYNYVNGIPNLYVASNNSVEYVKFNNVGNVDNYADHAFKITKSGAFKSCSNLKRVYGNIALMNSEIFSDCSQFSILGTETTTYCNVPMIDNVNNVNYHFKDQEVQAAVYGDRPRFQSGDNVTNITFQSTNSASNAFRSTACTILDAYYALSQIGKKSSTSGSVSANDLSSIFYGASNIKWTWNNSPSRHLFDYCGGVVSVSNAFRSTTGSARLYSPSHENGEVTFDDGLFSPLTSCTSISLCFTMSMVVDKYLFRRAGDIQYAFTNLSCFSPAYIIDDVSNDTKYPTYQAVTGKFSQANIQTDIAGDKSLGDLGGFFKSLGRVTNINGLFRSTSFINYDLFKEENNALGIPVSLSTMRCAFGSTYSNGTIDDFDVIFAHNADGEIRISGIYSCFTTGTTIRGTLVLTDTKDNGNTPMSGGRLPGPGLFGRFTNLTGINYSDVGGDFNSTTESFSGFRKVIRKTNNEYVFPYDLLQNCPNKTNITSFTNLFSGAGFVDSNDNYESVPSIVFSLPGRMFFGCSSLTDIHNLFYNINVRYNLEFENVNEVPTPPFIDCVNLSNVRYLFGVSVSPRRLNYLQGQIPSKLFYHGKTMIPTSTSGILDSAAEILLPIVDDPDFGQVLTVDETQTTATHVDRTTTYYDEQGDETYDTENWYRRVVVTTTLTYSGFIPITGSYGSINCVPTTNRQIRIETVTTVREVVVDPDTGEETIVSTDTTEVTTTNVQFGNVRDGIYTLETTNINYPVPNATITAMDHCFQGANIDAYSHQADYDISEREELSTYQPYTYTKEASGRWKKVTPNPYKYTMMWVYDGKVTSYNQWLLDSGQTPGMFEWLDDTTEDYIGQNKVHTPQASNSLYSEDNSGNFICAPDLLRYCTPSANISSLFAYCGQSSALSTQYNQFYSAGLLSDDPGTKPNCWSYGLHGRIVPYLLKPVPQITSLTQMFMCCKMLGWYEKDSIAYTIPESFFTYIASASIDFSQMFYACHFPNNINLGVFRVGTKTYNLNEIFRYLVVDTTSSARVTLDGIWKDNRLTLSNIKSAFMVAVSDDETSTESGSVAPRTQYIIFGNNFTASNYSRGTARNVYDGFTTMAGRFTGTKELPTDVEYRNYRER